MMLMILVKEKQLDFTGVIYQYDTKLLKNLYTEVYSFNVNYENINVSKC